MPSHKHRNLTAIAKSILVMGSIPIGSLIKINYVVGSHHLFFSCSAFLKPLLGVCGILPLSTACALAAVTSTHAALSLKYLALHLPGFFAALYLHTTHWSVRIGVPVACIVLFNMHPQGYAAMPYSLYWLIPMLLHRHKQPFLTALGSTFTAHAVGSTLWVYATGMHAALWYSLIPMVLLERGIMALGMTIGIVMLQKLGTPLESLILQSRSQQKHTALSTAPIRPS